MTLFWRILGRDKKSNLEKGDWVEIVDDHHVLKVSGITADQKAIHPLLQVKGIQSADVDQMYMRVTLSGTPEIRVSPTISKKTHALLRRWDQRKRRRRIRTKA